MKNIFEGAKFGDKFKTRDGQMAIVLGIYPSDGFVCCALENGSIESNYNFDGTLNYENAIDLEDLSIVSKWEEESDSFGEPLFS